MLQTLKILSGMAGTSARHHHVDWVKLNFFAKNALSRKHQAKGGIIPHPL
ncbi:MAG: hypothetical protein KBF98_12660 [Rhodoferax sp.]|jgi:hypothetical protein|nr:hypothetical protein [Rhodoferax sp.]